MSNYQPKFTAYIGHWRTLASKHGYKKTHTQSTLPLSLSQYIYCIYIYSIMCLLVLANKYDNFVRREIQSMFYKSLKQSGEIQGALKVTCSGCTARSVYTT